MSTGTTNHPGTYSERRAGAHTATASNGAPEHDLRIVATGIDSLYASVREPLDEGRLATALRVRGRAQEAADAEPWEIPEIGKAFLVQPHARRGYAVHMNSPSLDVWVGYEGNSQRPSMYMELRAAGIHAIGIEAAVREAQDVAAWFCPQLAELKPGEGLTASRVDLYADVQGWSPCLADDGRFVARGKAVGNHDAEVAADSHPRSRRRMGRVFSGFSFGRGHVAARIYNKTLEMKGRRSDWQRAIWQGADPDKDVWRVEVQYRRAVLTDFHAEDGANLSTVADILEHRQALWDYGVGKWLTLRTPNGDVNRSRRPVDPMWTGIQGAQIGSPSSPLVRERVANATLQQLLQGITGYLTSLLAQDSGAELLDNIRVIDAAMATGTVEDRERAVRMALQGMAPAVTAYCDRRQRRLLSVVDDKRRKSSAA